MVGFLWTTFLFSLGLIWVWWLCLGERARVFKLKNHTDRGVFFIDSFSLAFLVCKYISYMCLCGFWWVYPQSTNTLTRRRNRFTYKRSKGLSNKGWCLNCHKAWQVGQKAVVRPAMTSPNITDWHNVHKSPWRPYTKWFF